VKPRELGRRVTARDLVWLTVIVAVAIVLRLPGLTTGLWRDEGSTYFDATAPTLANPDQVTMLEEEKITAYYGGGTLYATPARSEPLI